MSSTNLLYQIALTLIPNIGDVRAKALLEHFGEAEKIFKATKSNLENIEGIGTIAANSIKYFNDFKICEEEIAFIEKNKIYGLTNTTTGAGNYTIGFIPNGANWTFTNNMISITNNNTVQAIGVLDSGAAGTRNYYYNSIYIGGTHAGRSCPGRQFLARHPHRPFWPAR